MDDQQFKAWVVESLTDLKVNTATNTQSLQDHMRRTDLLEKRVDGLWLRVLTVVGGLVGIAAGIARIVWH